MSQLAYECGYRIDAMSVRIGCSERRLLDIFKRDVGLGAKAWTRQERAVVARRMLAAGEKPITVAKRLGFNSFHNFRRDFIAFHQVSPTVFRHHHTRHRQMTS
ncbi:MAG: helix-turn-helix domain-containing protein [Luteolibacter sp.]